MVFYIEPKIEEKRYKREQLSSPRAEKSGFGYFSDIYEEEKNQTMRPLVFKKKLTDEAAELAFQKAIEKNPDAVSDITMQGDDKIYRLYWLYKEGPDSQHFNVNFTIKKDCQSMNVTFTNISDKTITVDWKQFKIDRHRVLLDGLDWIDFKGNGKIEPGMSTTVSVQPSLYKDGIPIAMFDLDKIKREELVYKVSIHVKSPETSKSLYTYSVHTKLKLIF